MYISKKENAININNDDIIIQPEPNNFITVDPNPCNNNEEQEKNFKIVILNMLKDLNEDTNKSYNEDLENTYTVDWDNENNA